MGATRRAPAGLGSDGNNKIRARWRPGLAQGNEVVRVAAMQATPILYDQAASVEKAVRLIRLAADKGATLVAFGEGWLPGYPVHALGAPGSSGWAEVAAAYLEAAIDIPGPVTDELCSVAKQASIDIVIGVAERDLMTRGTVYGTVLFVGAEGKVLGRHRKLKPAAHERIVWGDGDAVELRTHTRPYGVVSALNGCEHQMVLPTYAMAEQGTQIHVACWPGGDVPSPRIPVSTAARQHLLSQAFAVQTGAFVVSVGGTMTRDALPERYRGYLAADFTGDSVVIDPRGEIVAGPVADESYLIADCSMALARSAKVAFDCAGHSGRPELLKLWNQAADVGAGPAGQPGFGGGGEGGMQEGYFDEPMPGESAFPTR